MKDVQRTGVAIVTGAARRIGAVIARSLHRRGLDLVIHCRNSRADADGLVEKLVERRPGSAVTVSAELSDEGAPGTIVESAMRAFGRVDVLVNNASAFYPTPLPESSHADWQALIDSNQRMPFWLSLAAAEARGESGSIV